MAIEHEDIPEANLHEPKGVSVATSGKAYISDGAGSGAFAVPQIVGQAGATVEQVPVSDGAGGVTWKLNNLATLGRMDLINSSASVVLVGADVRLAASYTDVTVNFTQAINTGGFLFDGTNHLIIPRTGTYSVSTWISLSSSSAGSPTIAMDLNVNGVSAFPGSAIVTSVNKNANDVVELVGFGDGSFTAGDVIGLGFASDANTTLSFFDSVFSVKQIGT